jgi:hypothetical protein
VNTVCGVGYGVLGALVKTICGVGYDVTGD